MGMLRLEQDPHWRYTRTHGVWEANVPVGNGTYTLAGLDPSDSDLADNAEDPLVLVGTGRRGAATHKMQITLAPANRGYTALKLAVYSGNDLKVTSATLNCSQAAGADHDTDASSAQVNCDAEAVNNIKGGTYNGDTRAGAVARTRPDPATLYDYYLANGTWIDKCAPAGLLQRAQESRLRERRDRLDGACVPLLVVSSGQHSGAKAVHVKSRSANTAGPEQDVTGVVDQGIKYDVDTWIKAISSSETHFFLRLTIVSTGSGTQTFTSGETKAKSSDGWKAMSHSLTPTWTGSLTSAKLRIITKDGELSEFYTDDFSFKQNGTEHNICRVVLSPASNPFGASTNPRGIYLIDMADQKLFIKYARIVGTLVLITPKSDSEIGNGGPLHWEPAVRGFPALFGAQ